MKRAGVICILVLAFFGIAVSAYLSRQETGGNPLLCNIENLSDCNLVVSSPYSRFLGVSLADYGLLFYTILFVLAAFELVLVNQLLRHALQGLSLVGIFASSYSVYAQVFLVRALCVYCLTLAGITFFVALLAFIIEEVWTPRPRAVAVSS